MPIYEYRCGHCGTYGSALRPVSESQQPVPCKACGHPAQRIVSRPSVHRSRRSRIERLDPRYDRMVDRAMRDTQHAEPDRHLRRMKPLSPDD